MVAANPNYITKTTLGNDSTGTYPIYKYEFKPEQATVSKYPLTVSLFEKTMPKIIIITSAHGEEKASTIGLRNFMNDVCARWADDPLLDFIRWNVHLIIVPIVNPYGFVNHTRENGNGIDLNRNYSYYWDISDSGSKGASPFSEVETQYIRDILLANTDAMAFFDSHTCGTSGKAWSESAYHIIEGGLPNPHRDKMVMMAKDSIQRLSRSCWSNSIVPAGSWMGTVSFNIKLPTASAYAASIGIPASTLENLKKLVGESVVYSADALRIATENIGNIIINTVRAFNN